MKKLVLALLLCAASFGCYAPPPQLSETKVFTPQQRASHRIAFYDNEKSQDAICTATAIGPHAILTATHCNEGDVDSLIRVDLSRTYYHILAADNDGRDHVLYLLDGPAFTYLAEYDTAKARHPAVGDVVNYYGSGKGIYPLTETTGIAARTLDPSDVDEDLRLNLYAGHAIPGESGSAIYDKNGVIVGVLSYGITINKKEYFGAFELGFTAQEVRFAQNFSLQDSGE